MALKPQNSDGTVSDANAYGTVEGLRSYWSDRGVDLSTYTAAQLEVALILATDYIDIRYKFIGYQAYNTQGTQFPRNSVSLSHRGLPKALVYATYMLALRSVKGVVLAPDPVYNPGGQVVSSKKVKVGPIETDYTYAASSSRRPGATLPQFPDVDLALRAAGLLESANSGIVLRG